jgi:hypothetical protein
VTSRSHQLGAEAATIRLQAVTPAVYTDRDGTARLKLAAFALDQPDPREWLADLLAILGLVDIPVPHPGAVGARRGAGTARCGEPGGYWAHLREETQPCEPCRQAYRQRQRWLREHGGQSPLRPCGTNAAWRRHKAAAEIPCAACYQAHADHMAAQNLRRRTRRDGAS